MKDILTNWPKGPGLITIDHPDEPLECDFCDEKAPCAHIDCLCGDVMGICESCLQKIIDEFNKE